MSHSYKDRYYYSSKFSREGHYGDSGDGGCMLVLVSPNSTPQKITLEETGIMGGFRYLIVSACHTT